jgi:hypothetical protein
MPKNATLLKQAKLFEIFPRIVGAFDPTFNDRLTSSNFLKLFKATFLSHGL